MIMFKELLMLIGLIQAESLVNSKCDCGRFDASLVGNRHKRILNGETAVPHRYPWQVLLEIHHKMGETRCGGTLISKKHVLTAQHCFILGMLDNNQTQSTVECFCVILNTGKL